MDLRAEELKMITLKKEIPLLNSKSLNVNKLSKEKKFFLKRK